MIEISLEPRVCECCHSNDLEAVWSNRGVAKKSKETYVFRSYISVCRRCGFAFNSPSPKIEDLDRYYADPLPGYKGIALAYSIEARLGVLESYSSSGATFVEIGGDNPGTFHQRLAGLFGVVKTVEFDPEVSCDYRRIQDIPAGTIDVIAHYDVLEHVPHAMDFLSSCHRALKDGGVMVCEVPDLRLYPRNLLLLEFEHLNHFTVATLANLAQQCGLQLIETGHATCSRPFGFVSVFRKSSSRAMCSRDLPFEYEDARSCIQGGSHQISRMLQHIQAIKQRLLEVENKGGKITLWGVTDLLRRLLETCKLPETAIVVDSDPRRRTHLEEKGVTVFLPKDHLEHMKESELLVICAPRYKSDILDWIVSEVGTDFRAPRLEVLGTGNFGEPLM